MILVMGTIFFLSHQPGDTIVIDVFPGMDKIAHGLAYGVLALTVLLAAGPVQREWRPVRVAVLAVAVCLCYGMSDEFHQSFIPGRFVSAADIVADVVGGGVAVSCWLILRKRREKGEMDGGGRDPA